MRRSLVVASSVAILLLAGAVPPVRALTGDLPGVPGQIVEEGPLAPQPLCQSEFPAAPGVTLSDHELRIGTYNVLHTQDPDGNPTSLQRVGLLAAAIGASGADAMGLQEVAKSATLAAAAEAAGYDDGDDVRGLMVELIAQRLAGSTGESWSWCWFASNAHVPLEPEPSPGGGGGPLTELMTLGSGQQTGNGNEFREGVAILSRHAILAPSVRRLSLRTHEAAFCDELDPTGCQLAVVFDSRVIMHATIDAPGGLVDLYTTHLAHGVTSESDDTKARQLREGLDYIEATEDINTPTFFVGDFNTDATVDPDAARYQSVLTAGFVDSYAAALVGDAGDPLGTSSQDVVRPDTTVTVDRTIDYIFAKGISADDIAYGDIIGEVPAERSDVAGYVWPSDHLGVVVTFVRPAG